MKRFLSLAMAFVLLASHCAVAQDEIRSLTKFRVLTKSGDRFVGIDGRLSQETLAGTLRNGEAIVIPTSDIRALDVYTGSQSGKWTVIGAGLGLLTSLTAILVVGTQEDRELNTGAAVGVTVIQPLSRGVSYEELYVSEIGNASYCAGDLCRLHGTEQDGCN